MGFVTNNFRWGGVDKPVGIGVSAAAFSPFEVAWTDAYWADDPGWSNPGDGNAVSTWRSGGSGGRAATQGTGSLQPTFRSSVANLNSRAAVEFDGAGDVLTSSSYSLDLPGTAVWVGRFTGTPANPRSDWFCGISTNVSDLYDWSAAGNLIGSVTVTTNRSAAVRIYALSNSGSNTLVVNGTSNSGGFSGSRFELNGVRIGGSFAVQTAFAGYYAGDAAADSKWSQMVSWVSSYYGLTLG
jgi:hypothetical protein